MAVIQLLNPGLERCGVVIKLTLVDGEGCRVDRLADGAQLSLLHPEVLLYVPTEDGSMAFVGVEYIIPAAAWSDAAPPEFMGRTLHYNTVQDIWALHVWVGRDNPEGIFEDWNPDVSCEFAE